MMEIKEPVNNRDRSQWRDSCSRFEMQAVPQGGVLLILVDPLETTVMHITDDQAEEFRRWMNKRKGA